MATKIVVILLLSIFALPYCRAEVQNRTIFGHNLSPTTNTMNEGSWAIGSYALAYGYSDKVVLATSPWLYYNYNMTSAIVRYPVTKLRDWELRGQSAYFKTYSSSYEIYHMEALSQHLTLGKKINSSFVVHYNLSYMYFLDETKPFSLRREPLNNDPGQWTFTALFEAPLTKDFGLLGEIGVLGLNYHYPQAVMGASLQLGLNQWLLQFGFSMTGTIDSYFSSDKIDNNEVEYSPNGFYYPSRRYARASRDFSVHPEIQIQYYFR